MAASNNDSDKVIPHFIPPSNEARNKTKQKLMIPNKTSRQKIYGKCQAEIGNSSKGHAFAEYRKLKTLTQYKKLRRHQRKANKEEDDHENEIQKSKWKGKRPRHTNFKNKYQTAKSEFENKKAEIERQKQEARELHKKREEEFQMNQEKRRETHRKLTKRTKRGQPIMSNHVECLLERIQKG